MAIARRLAALVLSVVLVGVATSRDGRAQGPAAPAPPVAPPQQAPVVVAPDSQQPTFRTGIDFVRVDVIVTEKGQAVSNLTAQDFEVREDGKIQQVEQFRLVKIDGTVRPGDPAPRPIRNRDDEELEAARDDVRVIVLFLDDYHTRLGSSLSVKQALTQFIETQVSPLDLLAVMTPLMPASELSFTRDRARIISAINGFQGYKFRYQPRNAFEQQYSRQPSEVVENIRNQVVMGALRGLSTRLGAVREGRKSIVYVSEGFTVLLPPQLRVQDAELSGGLPNGALAGTGENDPREQTASAFAMGDIALRMRDIYDLANRNNVSIYSLDPRGLAVSEFGIDENVGPQQDRNALRMTQDTLRMLSENTDGRAIVNRNDLGTGMKQIVQDAGSYYLLGYTSSSPSDGKFHEIKVSVKRRGLDVRNRRGFWAPTLDDIERATRAAAPAPAAAPAARAVEAALGSIAPAVRANQYVRTWVGSTRAADGRTHVTLVWEALPALPGSRRETAGRVSLIAARQTGELVFRGRSGGAGAAPGAQSVASVAQRVEFDAPPGPLELRLTVEAAEGGVIDNEIRTITVPDLTAARTRMSTPRVFRARTARELQALVADGAAVPIPAREFSRAERVLVRLDAYRVGSEAPRVTASLLNRTGQKVMDVPVTTATAGGTHQVDLGLNQLASGEYVIEIAVVGAEGDEVKDLVPLRIGS